MILKIAVSPDDGIVPEIIEQTMKVVRAIHHKYNHDWITKKALVGACAIDGTGNPFPQETEKLCLESNTVIFGALGSPKYDNNPTSTIWTE